MRNSLTFVLSLWLATPAWATLQVGMDGPAAPSTTVTNFAGISGTSGWNATENNRYAKAAIAGKVVQLCATGSADPDNGAGVDSYALSLRINSASPSPTLTTTFADGYVAGTMQCAYGTIAVAANDLLAIQSVPSNTPAASTFRYFLVFSSTTDGESFLAGGSGGTNLLTNGTTEYLSIANRQAATTTEGDLQLPVAAVGTFDTFTCTLSGAPANGAGTQTYTMTFRVNEANSIDTCAISEAATTCTADADDVALVVGDRIDYSAVSSGTPTARLVTCTGRFVSTAVDQFLFGAHSGATAESNSATQFQRVMDNNGGGISATETTTDALLFPMTINAIAVNLSGTPGAGTDYTFTLRNSQVSQDTRVTVANTSTAGSALRDTQLPSAGLGAIQCVPTGTPTARKAEIGFAAHVPSVYLNAGTLQGAALK